MPDRVSNQAPDETREDYTGHELDGETSMHYAGARYYMSALGRWNRPDPLADEYPSHSPYNYVVNTPVNAIDPNGKWVVFIQGDVRAQKLGTFGAARGIAFDGSTLIAYETGDIGVGFGGGGGGGLSIGISRDLQTVDHFLGWGIALGGYGFAKAGGQAEVTLAAKSAGHMITALLDRDQNQEEFMSKMNGRAVTFGGGIGKGAGLYGAIAYTEEIARIDIDGLLQDGSEEIRERFHKVAESIGIEPIKLLDALGQVADSDHMKIDGTELDSSTMSEIRDRINKFIGE